MIQNKTEFIGFLNELPIQERSKQNYCSWVNRIEKNLPDDLSSKTVKTEADVVRLADKLPSDKHHREDAKCIIRYYLKFLQREAIDFRSPEEISSEDKISEGRLKTVMVNFYERSAKARHACIEAHGAVCAVCKFDFGKIYGAVGKGFIHVHHLRDLASLGKEYEVNPVEDLCPVCPNCHAMIHKRNPSYTITELKGIIDVEKK